MSDKMDNLADGDTQVGDDVGDIDEEQEEALLKSDDDDPMNSNDEDEVDGCGDADRDDDDSDDDAEDEEERLIKDYLETLGQINQNKYGYENYVQLIEIANKLSDLEKIRQSYELFSSVYPVAPELWLKFLMIENSLASSETEVDECEKLFRKALNDYFCPQVALEFASFAPKSKNADNIWPELLFVYALHTMYGRKIIELWKSYIMAKEDTTEKIKYVTETYEKLLRIPMYNMEETYIEFKLFVEKSKSTEVTVNWEQIDKKYNRAKSHLQKLLPFESKLSTLDAKFHQNRAALYKEYILEADRFADENVLQILYERMVTECCLNPSCWLDYITYLEKRDKYSRPDDLESFPVFEQNAMDVINRALRNCTWSELLFIRKMRLGEKLGYSKNEVKEVFEQGLEAGFQTPEPLVALWLEYLSYLARNTNFDDEKEAEMLRANFDFAWTSLGKQWGVLADCNCELLQLWGRLEYSQLKDPSKGKELWSTVMESADNSSKAALWMEFVHLELSKGADAARKMYRKALNTPTIDDPYTIASSWIRFERCNGTIEQIATCQEHCENLIRQVELQKQKQNEKQKTWIDEKPGSGKAAKKRKPGGPDIIAEASPTKKLKNNAVVMETKKASSKKSDAMSISGKSDVSDLDPAYDSLRVFLSNLDYNVTEDEIRECFTELIITKIHLMKTANGKGRGFGYAEFPSESEAKKALGFDRRKLKDRPVYISSVLREREQRQKFKYSDNLEPQKLFIKGIPYDSTEEDLKAIFLQFGEVKDIRIVYHKSGKPKGIAYIEYDSASSASTAVMKLDQTEIRGHKINVAISAPPPKPTTKETTTTNFKKILSAVGIKAPVSRGEQKPRLSFIPASVRKNVLGGTPAPANGSSELPVKPKSNDDFRKLLNK